MQSLPRLAESTVKMNSPKLTELVDDTPLPPAVNGWAWAQSPAVGTARLLALALPGRSMNPEQEAFDGLAALNKRLVDAPDDEIRQGLARQAALLEALVMRYTRLALEARSLDYVERYQALATKCGKAHLAALGALHKLNQDRRNAQALEVD